MSLSTVHVIPQFMLLYKQKSWIFKTNRTLCGVKSTTSVCSAVIWL